MTPWIRRSVAGVVALAAGKCILLTTNDEWPEVKYALQRCFNNHLMQHPTKPLPKKKIVVLGTGWGAMSAIQTLDHDNCIVTVVSPRSFFFYTPLLAGMATGNVSHSSILEPIRKHLFGFSDAEYVQAECTSINFKDQTVECAKDDDHRTQLVVPYDQLIIAVGAEPATFNIPGVKEKCMFIKEIDDGIQIHNKILDSLESANTLIAANASDSEVEKVLHWVIIGGGPTGVELTAELNDFVQRDVAAYFPHLSKRIKISLLEGTDKVLGMFDPEISSYATKVLGENGANIVCNAMVSSVNGDSIEYKLKKGEETTHQSMEYGTVIWAGGINIRPITSKIIGDVNKISGDEFPIQSSRRGIEVDEKFRVRGLEKQSNVFAIGDCAVVEGCSPTGQAAFQQGKYIGRLLRDINLQCNATENCESMERKVDLYDPFKFHNYGALAYVGTSKGVAELKTVLWNNPLEVLSTLRDDQNRDSAEKKSKAKSTIVEGSSAYVLWRSLYFSKLLSPRNKFQVAFDWLKIGIFGRDISSPHDASSMKSFEQKDVSKKTRRT